MSDNLRNEISRQEMVSRNIPLRVKRALRKEVNFGCPVRQCGNPYLEYHHFDPPWKDEKHHRVEGMIALCATHHAKADAYTVEQCREMKSAPFLGNLSGNFEYLRKDISVKMGGVEVSKSLILLSHKDAQLVWLEVDEKGYKRLNINHVRNGSIIRILENNNWNIDTRGGLVVDIESPPSGRKLIVKYSDSSSLSIEFMEREQDTVVELEFSYPGLGLFFSKNNFQYKNMQFNNVSINDTNVGIAFY